MVVDLEDYSLARVIKGIYDSEYKTIALDSDGNIVGVFKGDYAGDLKTIAVDSQGRIQAVLTDPEDVFGNPNYMGAAELAARLGSINTFERRGTTVWMDDFEGSTLKWQPFTTGDGGSITLNTAYARNGNQSCKMVPGSGDNYTAYMYKYIPLPVESKIGFEVSFTRHADIKHILLTLGFYDGAAFKECGLALSFAEDKLYYLKGAADWVEFQDGWIPYASNYLFSTAKLVFDYSTTGYIRALVNDVKYDLSAYDYYSTGSGVNPYMVFNITVANTKAGNPALYVDDVIFTQNEP